MITAIVLAAGKSSRMPGKNKMFLPFRDSFVVSNVIAELIVSKVDEIIAVTDSEEHINVLAIVTKVRTVVNENADKGMTSSIQKGVLEADEKSHYMVCLGDMPLIASKEYDLLIDNFLSNPDKAIVQPITGQRPGNPVLFSNHFRSEILNLQEANGCKPIVQTNRQFVKQIEVSSQSFFIDIDTMEDYQKILKNLK